MNQPLLPGDAQLDVARLGPFISEHRTGSKIHWAGIISGGLLTGFLTWVAWTIYCVQGFKNVGVMLFVAAIGLWAAAALCGLVSLLWALSWRLLLFDGGFVLLRGGRPRSVYWDDVRYYTHRAVVHYGLENHKQIFRLDSGKKLVLDGVFREVDRLAAEIRPRCRTAVLAKAAMQLLNGQPVAFHKIELTRDGLRDRRGELPWADIIEIDLVHRTISMGGAPWIMIYRQGEKKPWRQFPATNFPNVEVFLTLSEQLRHGHLSGEIFDLGKLRMNLQS